MPQTDMSWTMSSTDSTEPTKIRSFPDLVRKEALAAILAMVFLAAASVLFDAPVSGPADPAGVPSGDVKAPWIFVGIQQTLRYFSPLIAGVVLPLGAIFTLALIPYFGRRYRKLACLAFFPMVIVSVVLTLWGYFW
jgi:hypothetical protein